MKKLLLQLAFSTIFLPLLAQYNYPATKSIDSTDTYFGVTYHDPYRWLEKLQQPETENWFKQQANYTDSILNGLNGRDSLVAEWQRLNDLNPANYFGFAFENNRLFYRKTMPGEIVSKLYFRQGMKGTEILLFDPSSYIPGKTLTLESAAPTSDGRQIAVAYSE